MKNLSFSVFFFMFLLFIVGHETYAEITCDNVISMAVRCVPYARGTDTMPSAECCIGLQQLAHSAQSIDDKKTVCWCLKNSIGRFNGIQDRFLSKIPDICKIRVGFPISLSTNCDKIH